MDKVADYKTEIERAKEKKWSWEARRKKLFFLFIASVGVSFATGFLNGIYALGGWEVFVPVMTIVNYILYFFWSESQLRRYEVEHRALGYYANDKKSIPVKQLEAYDRLKYGYILNMLKNTALIALMCGVLVFAGQKAAGGFSLWWLLVVLPPAGIALVMRNQQHQINRFGKNGTVIMSK